MCHLSKKFAVTSDLYSVNSFNHEEPLNDYETEKLNLDIKFEPVTLNHPEEITLDIISSLLLFLKASL